MSLSFTPQSEEELLNLFEDGVYNFQVKNAINTYSKNSGIPMIKLTLTVFDSCGKERTITDYLMTSLMYKLKHFCDSTGLQKVYNAGKFSPEDCIGKSGKCKIKIDRQEGYQPKNAVQDYVMTDKGAIKVDLSASPKDELFDSDIPF